MNLGLVLISIKAQSDSLLNQYLSMKETHIIMFGLSFTRARHLFSLAFYSCYFCFQRKVIYSDQGNPARLNVLPSMYMWASKCLQCKNNTLNYVYQEYICGTISLYVCICHLFSIALSTLIEQVNNSLRGVCGRVIKSL